MEKTEFLKKISSMTRQEIEKSIDDKNKKHKLIYPAVYLKRGKDKNSGNKDK